MRLIKTDRTKTKTRRKKVQQTEPKAKMKIRYLSARLETLNLTMRAGTRLINDMI